MSKRSGRCAKSLWPSQNIWTLPTLNWDFQICTAIIPLNWRKGNYIVIFSQSSHYNFDSWSEGLVIKCLLTWFFFYSLFWPSSPPLFSKDLVSFLWLPFPYIFQRLFLCFLLYNLTMSNVSQKLLMAPPMVLVWHQLNVGIGVDQVKETAPVDLELAVFSSRHLIT